LVSEITITWSIAFISAKWHKKRIKPLRPDSYLSTGFDKEPKKSSTPAFAGCWGLLKNNKTGPSD
jgi:hypothetical protein